MTEANSARDTLAPVNGKSSADPPSDARAIVREFRPYLIGAGILPVVAALYWGRGVLIPIALACLFTFLLSPIVDALERTGLGRIRGGRVIAATLVVVLVFSALGGAVWVIAPQVTAL